MTALVEIITRKKDELKKLQVEIAALEEAHQLTLGISDQIPRKKRAARSDVKSLVLSLLEEVGSAGLVATSAVDIAEKRGIHLERGTVSSLLSSAKARRCRAL